MDKITHILNAVEQGDPKAAEQLLPLVYEELRQLAAHKLAQEKPGQTLQATALVHEAYLRLVTASRSRGDQGKEEEVSWDSRRHFFAAAAEAMRRILIDSARRKRRLKHGGNLKRVDLDAAARVGRAQEVDLLALDEALTKLGAAEPVKAELVKLRFFAGMTIPEAARVLGISRATAERYWTYARVWLYCEMDGPDRPGSPEESPGPVRGPT